MVDRKGFKPLPEVCSTSILSITPPTPKSWCPRRDSNSHELVSKTRASFRLGYAGKSWSGRQDLNLRTLDSKSSPYSRLRNAQRNCKIKNENFKSKKTGGKVRYFTVSQFWLRGKDSNLCFLIQSQASCRLDDPERMLQSAAGFSILNPKLLWRPRCDSNAQLQV
jgi:hypothetical protein